MYFVIGRPSCLAAFCMSGLNASAPWMITAVVFLQPSSLARFMRPTAYSGWLPIGKESVLVYSEGEIAQHMPQYATLPFARVGTIASPVKLNEPTTATALSATALRAHAVASVGVPFRSQNFTSTGWPLMPPLALMYSP